MQTEERACQVVGLLIASARWDGSHSAMSSARRMRTARCIVNRAAAGERPTTQGEQRARSARPTHRGSKHGSDCASN